MALYQGKFKCKNPRKYKGDTNNICYRSSWELSVMLWCDQNPKIISWSSEELVIPYLCATDGSSHRYFVDFVICFDNGTIYWVEIKPEKYMKPPVKPKKKTKKYITEVMNYIKNQSKWQAARSYAEKNGATFSVWTEKSLETLGIKLLGK